MSKEIPNNLDSTVLFMNQSHNMDSNTTLKTPVNTNKGSHPEKTSKIYNTPCCFVCYIPPTTTPSPIPTNDSCCCICFIPDSCCWESLNFCVSDCMNICLGCLSFVDGN